ncbi:GH39 family glycosyl hydrolase [Terriglobus roseus]|nr:cellulase family glycosylhydrolase [Terriglobus roseus]
MHIHNAATGTPWPDTPFRSWMLWDAGVAWPDLEPRYSEWHFERLDQYVTLAQQHHVHILLTLGLTPAWATARPKEKSDYQPGNAAEPSNMQWWRDYVRAVATRYKGRIEAYEIWNEPNRKDAFSGTVPQLVMMTREAYGIIKKVDPGALVVSASATASNGIDWFNQYLALGAGRYVDAVGYHLYVNPLPPEEMLPLGEAVRHAMKMHGIGNKPLWDTETGWAKPKVFQSQEEKAAFVSRTLIVNWPMGVQRLYWYAWDNHQWVTLEMVTAETQAPTSAARAYATTRFWMLGASMKPCKAQLGGTWTCALNRPEGRSWIVWNVNSLMFFNIPAEWHVRTVTDLQGTTRPVAGASVSIGISPILLRG